MRTARHLGIALLLGAVLVGCGQTPTPTVEPGAAPDGEGTADGGDGCRPPLADGEDPFGGGGDWDSGADAPLGEDAVAAVLAAAYDDHADTFAGLWLDTRSNEVVVMLAGDDRGAVLDDLRRHADHPDAVVCMEADHTEAELDDLANEAFTALQASGAPVSGGTDMVHNRVTIDFEGDAEQARDLLGDLADHPALVVTQPDCAEIGPVPDDAVALPGDSSTCMSMHALITGTLIGDAATGCLWLEAGDGRVDIAWPRGWYVTGEGVVHDHHGQARATIGDEVSGGGGHVPDAAPETCRDPDGDGSAFVSSVSAD